MTKTQAHRILDKAKDGQPISRTAIDSALIATGDHAPDGGQRMDFQATAENQRGWEAESADMVDGCEDGDSQTSWSGWSGYIDRRNEAAT